MKSYEVELRRTSFITVWVDAATEEEAEALAFEQIRRDYYDTKYASWDVESIEEVESTQGESK